MYTVEHLGEYLVEIGGVGKTKKGVKLICSEKVARDLKNDPNFRVIGLAEKKNQKGDK